MFQRLTERVLKPPAFGLDISDLTVKFCRVVPRGGMLAVAYFGEIAVPEGVVVGGEIKKPDELANVLREGLATVAGRGVHERYCVASLPEERSFVRVLELPQVKAEDLPNAVRWEVEGAVPLPFDEIYYDYEPVPPPPEAAPDHRDVLITAFPRSIVESYTDVLVRAGFVPLALELESQAISRALVGPELVGRSLIIVDLGMNRTSFILFAGGSLVFTKSITVGGHDFETAIAHALGVSAADAREIKVAAGLNKAFREGAVFSALEPHLKAVVGELEQVIVFYRDHPQKRHEFYGDLERILLCGGDANLIGLEKYFATTLKRLTVLGDPFVNLHEPTGTIPPIPRNKALKYTTAIGLALRAAGY